jgi:hypothetical protein
MNKLKVLKKVCKEMDVDFDEFYEDEGINTIEGWVSFDDLEDETFEDEVREIINDSNDEID